MKFQTKSSLPRLGVGLSFRPEIAVEIYQNVDEFDFIEVIVDNVLNGFVDARFQEQITSRIPTTGHGVNGSIGSMEPLDKRHLRQVAEVARTLQCVWYSDHLAYTRIGEFDVGQLMPVQFSECNVSFMASKIREMSEALPCPFLVENPAYYFEMPGSTISEVEFIVKVLEQSRCGLLLDVNNLYANAINHGYDPYDFVDRVPADALVEVHVAGGEKRGGLYIDTHGDPINAEVFELLSYTIATKRPNSVLLEREQNFPAMGELLAEIRELKRMWGKPSTVDTGAARPTQEHARAATAHPAAAN